MTDSTPSVSILRHAKRGLSPSQLPWPSLLGLLVFAIMVNANGVPLLGDPDSHWHIAVGNWIIEHGKVPTVDTFSHTFAGQPWIAKEWLSQVVLAAVYAMAGWGGVMVLCAGAVAVTFALMMRLLQHDIAPLPAALFTVAAFFMSASHLLARPHVLALPFMLIWVAGLVRAVEERRAPHPLLLLAMLLWANLHGGFTLGLLLCGAFALEAVVTARDMGERRAMLIGWVKFGVAAVLVACITPYGPQSMLVTLQIFGLGDVLGMIEEWKSPNFQAWPIQELIVLLAASAALSGAIKLPVVRLLVVIGLSHLFLKHARNADALALLAPIAIAPILARQWPSLRAAVCGPAARYGLLACVLVAAAFGLAAIKFADVHPPADTTPVGALAFAQKAGLKGGVFNDYAYGGVLIHTRIPTFIDGRAELFGADFVKQYVNAVNLRGSEPLEALLDRYGIEWTLLRTAQPANRLLERLPGWRRLYSDDSATIFARTHTP
jgi:hypothetical protein